MGESLDYAAEAEAIICETELSEGVRLDRAALSVYEVIYGAHIPERYEPLFTTLGLDHSTESARDVIRVVNEDPDLSAEQQYALTLQATKCWEKVINGA